MSIAIKVNKFLLFPDQNQDPDATIIVITRAPDPEGREGKMLEMMTNIGRRATHRALQPLHAGHTSDNVDDLFSSVTCWQELILWLKDPDTIFRVLNSGDVMPGSCVFYDLFGDHALPIQVQREAAPSDNDEESEMPALEVQGEDDLPSLTENTDDDVPDLVDSSDGGNMDAYVEKHNLYHKYLVANHKYLEAYSAWNNHKGKMSYLDHMIDGMDGSKLSIPNYHDLVVDGMDQSQLFIPPPDVNIP